MISIESAIEESKKMGNISNGGSECYDFGDCVLVKYVLPLEYSRPDHRARQNQESIMKSINEKNLQGVNTPRHIDMKRVIDEKNDICYVLQEKCRGKNCDSMSLYGATFEKVIADLEYVARIPFEQYEKLIYDGCMLFEMGYEGKNKNLFYDEETGFWYIDFIENEEDYKFDFNDPEKIFKALKQRIPNPIQIASKVEYGAQIPEDIDKKTTELSNIINAKYFLAAKKTIPKLEKYEKFYLLDKSDDFKKYVMDKGIVKRDLFEANEEDIKIYYELYDSIVDNICNRIIKGKYFEGYSDEIIKEKENVIVRMMYDDVKGNQVRNDSDLFNLVDFFGRFIDKSIIADRFSSEYYDQSSEALRKFTPIMMKSIYEKIKMSESNFYINKFIGEYEKRNLLDEEISKSKM